MELAIFFAKLFGDQHHRGTVMGRPRADKIADLPNLERGLMQAHAPLVHVVFLVVGRPAALYFARNLAAQLNASSTSPVQFHLVTDGPPEPSDWARGYSLGSMPAEALALHQNFSHLTHGPGAVYMWKPLLHWLLPLDRAIIIDSDVLVLADLAELWRHFDSFGETQVLGLANEQAPLYAELSRRGFNGGVQLAHLQRMRRADSVYDAQLRAAASGGYGHIGYLGDQTMFSVMRDRAPSLFYQLPCGWNRQLSNHFVGHPRFAEYYACDEPCSLVHANQPQFKPVIGALQRLRRRPSCADCRAALAHESPQVWSQPHFELVTRAYLQCCDCNATAFDSGAEVTVVPEARGPRGAHRSAGRGRAATPTGALVGPWDSDLHPS